MRMRFRTDGWHYADMKAAGETFEQHHRPDEFYGVNEGQYEVWKKFFDDTPKAEPGDVWRIFYGHGVDGVQVDDWVAGYAICCIGCGRVHNWTSALNCGQKVKRAYQDTQGNRQEYETCIHQEQHTSCWSWTGDAEAGTLTAASSLQVVADRCPWHCGWHGFIQNGDIHV